MKMSCKTATVLVWVASVLFQACGGGSVSPAAPSVVTTPTTNGTSALALAYVDDIKPILDADCVRCHNTRFHLKDVDVSTYAAVLGVVDAGSEDSPLVRVTRPGGMMYENLTADQPVAA